MTTPTAHASDVRRGDTVRFVPATARRHVTISVERITTTASGVLFFHGVRLNANGCIDSQTRENAYAAFPTTTVTIS